MSVIGQSSFSIAKVSVLVKTVNTLKINSVWCHFICRKIRRHYTIANQSHVSVPLITASFSKTEFVSSAKEIIKSGRDVYSIIYILKIAKALSQSSLVYSWCARRLVAKLMVRIYFNKLLSAGQACFDQWNKRVIEVIKARLSDQNIVIICIESLSKRWNNGLHCTTFI